MMNRLRSAARVLPLLLLTLPLVQIARAQIPSEPNMVVEAEGAGLGRIEFSLTGKGLREPARYVFDAKGGAIVGGIALPKDGGAEYDISAYDTEGRLTHFGKGPIGNYDQTERGAQLTLEPIDGGAGIVVSLARERIVLNVEKFTGSPERISVNAEAYDAFGKRAFIKPGDITWQLTNGRVIHLIPDLEKPGVDVVPDKDLEVYELCPLEPTVVACKLGVVCKPKKLCDDPFVKVSAGARHTCGLTQAGYLRCWGDNSRGQLGAPTTATCGPLSPMCSTTPIPVVCPQGAPCRFTQVASGGFVTAAVDVDGEVWWWGSDDVTHRRVTAVLAGTPQKFSLVAAGALHACAIAQSNSNVWCWGFNGAGETGSPVTANDTPHTAPYRILPTMKFKRIAAGGQHTCGVGQAGTDVVCWGLNNSLESSGSPVTNGYPDPTQGPFFFQQFGGLVNVQDVSASLNRSCANVSTGVRCWGGGFVPLNASSFGHPDKVTVGQHHVCALSGQQASCLGANMEGQLGNGTTSQTAVPSTTPTAVVTPPPNYTEVSAGDTHTCGLTPDGDIFCWGRNVSGQLGNGSTNLTPNPAPLKVLR